MQVDSVMRKLDRATPRELQKTLQTLNRQLDYMERGSDAWNAHIEKIKKVKSEIASVNEEIRGQEGWFSRMNRKLNDWQMSIMGAAAAVTGLIMAGRKAVSAYADMDAEMANVRKYTGMTAEEVEVLNEEMKTIDTRSSREELNRLAQEAGRLGKTSQEDVMGFVRAADKINVALDELGEGATLTLSKLTNIFGDEERLGTEKALLAVGSVINELSQNCTASAPYLANWTTPCWCRRTGEYDHSADNGFCCCPRLARSEGGNVRDCSFQTYHESLQEPCKDSKGYWHGSSDIH